MHGGPIKDQRLWVWVHGSMHEGNFWSQGMYHRHKGYAHMRGGPKVKQEGPIQMRISNSLPLSLPFGPSAPHFLSLAHKVATLSLTFGAKQSSHSS